MAALRPVSVGLLLAAVALLARAPDAQAQSGSRDGQPQVAAQVDSSAAMPALYRVGLAVSAERGPAIALGTGYGLTERLSAGDGVHHRIKGSAALSFPAAPWLQLGLRFDGRLDRHQDGDAGAVGEPRVLLRVSQAASDRFHLGAEVDVWLVGSNFPSVEPEATTVDSKLLLSWLVSRSFYLGAQGGFRLDSSAKSRPAGILSTNDSLALGVSEFNSALLGLGLLYRLGASQFVFELTGEVLVGKGAPSGESPARVTAGFRHALTEALQLEVMTEVGLSGRPELEPGKPLDPLIPIEPRVGLEFGLRYRPAPPAARVRIARPQPTPAKPEVKAPRRPQPPKVVAVSGTVRGTEGQPVAGARIELAVADKSRQVESDAEGHFELAPLPIGSGTLTVSADGFEPYQESVSLQLDAQSSFQVGLVALPHRGQLRGLVRSFKGQGLEASVQIEPLGLEVHTNDEGRFEAEVEPGDYQVTVRSVGYRTQRRTARVEKDGVTILNVDLRKKRRRGGRDRRR